MSNNKKQPKVSVLLPVYNTARFLRPALDSLLEQTFTDFEIIAIDDGSRDDSGKILDDYAARDSRLRVVHRENRGLVATLNEAIELSRGEYLARQDGDDISFRTRFEQEVSVLDTHPDVVLVSGGFEIFDEDDEYLYREVVPSEDEDIKRAMYLRNPIGHGSVMFRKSACLRAGLYSPDCGPIEDYELWGRLAEMGKFYALEHAVFRWRVNLQGITRTNNALQISLMKRRMNDRWNAEFPRVISRKALNIKAAHYYQTYTKRGVDMKHIMLADNAQLAVKMIRHGHLLRGAAQLLAVALTGRTGLRITYYRMRAIQHGTLAAIRRRIAIG